MIARVRGVYHLSRHLATGQRLFSSNAKTELNSENALRISETSINRLKSICTDGSFLRISVEGGGCSGFQYKFEFDTKMNKDDLVFGPSDARVVVDNISIDYCAGTTLDYQDELIRSGFRMIGNPKADQACSCGSSFSIKLD